MRKFLDQNFWSHGTPLGSLGPLSQQDTILGAGPRRQLMIYVIIGQLQAAPCMCFCFEVAMENRLIPRWRHTTHPGFFISEKIVNQEI